MNRLANNLIGRYELLDPVATTGLATTYRARDTTDGKVVALKLLHAYFSRDPDALGRYLDQLERVRELRHPNIVPLYGVEQDGELTAVAMEYVPWPTLKARRRRKMPPGEALAILRQVAAALDHAHAQGIVHRDLRPSNVFYDETSGRAVISDFGTIALVEGGHLLLRSTVSTPAPSYASPEQLQGLPQDPRNDVYALGALAYELLTGEIPFDALSPYTVLSRQLNTIPDPPSYWSETLPVAVDDVVLKALKRSSEERYASCGEMVEALTRAAGPQAAYRPMTVEAAARPEHAGAVLRSEAAQDISIEEGRVICTHCGSGNPAMALRCQTCWGSLVAQPVVTQEEEEQWLGRYLGRLRLRKRILWGAPAVLLTGLLALWIYNVVDVRPPLPPPSTSITSVSAGGDWATIQRDLLHTGVVPGPAFSPQGTVQRLFQSVGPILATPAVAAGRVYLATSDRRIVALDKMSGQILWTHPVDGPVNSSPAFADGLVYVGLRSGALLALDATTGKRLWSYQTKNPIYGSVAVSDGALYVGSGDHYLYSLDASTGEFRWKTETGEWILGTPTISKGIVVVGAQDGEMYMVDASNGTLRYQLNVSSTVDNAVTIVDDAAYFTTRTGNIMAINYTEKDVSFRKAKIKIQSHLFIWDVISKAPRIPGLLWNRRLRQPAVAELAVADGRVFLASSTGRLRAFNAKTGADIWEVKNLPRLYSSPIVSGDTIVQPASDGTIYGFNAATGEEKWRVPVREGITTSAVLAEGVLYVPTTAGNLYAVQ